MNRAGRIHFGRLAALRIAYKGSAQLQVELNRLKNEAIARFAEGKLEGEALISGFIAHVNDARNYLNRLILHERENLEDRARHENRSSREL